MRRWFIICSVLLLLLFTACKVDNLVSQGTVRFNPNGGSGYMASQTVFAGQPQKLYTNAYTREDYFFIGWNTQKDGAGTFYKENETYTYDGKESEMNLYAQWKKSEGTYSICFVDLMYDYNEKIIEVGYGEDYQLPDITELYYHENFLEWNTIFDGSGKSYANKAVVKNLTQPGGTVYLYACWAVELRFDANSGYDDPNTPPSIFAKSFETISLNDGSGLKEKTFPESPFPSPYEDHFYPKHVFRGWSTNSNGCDGNVYLKKNGVVEGAAPSKDSLLYAIWGYKYNTIDPQDPGQEKKPVSVFHVDAYSAITHCEQDISEIIATKKRAQSFHDYLHLYCNFVILATGPLYDPILVDIQKWERGEEITRKVGNSRYSYVVWDNEKDTYKLFDLYGRIDRNLFWKEPDTDVLIVFDVASVYSEDPDKQIILNCDMLPSKDYMSSWGNPTLREPGDQIDPLIFRALFPESTPEAPEYIYSSTPLVGIPGRYYCVGTFAPAKGSFWETDYPEENCNMVMTALF